MELFEEIRKAHDREELRHPSTRESLRRPPKSGAPSTGVANATAEKTSGAKLPVTRSVEVDDRCRWRPMRVAPRKQHHTARRVFQRLVEELGADVGESTVRRYVAAARARSPVASSRR